MDLPTQAAAPRVPSAGDQQARDSVVGLVRGALQLISAVARRLVKRRSLARLGTLDERMLRDIGLNRSDVDRALSMPWYVDPSGDLERSRRLNGRRR